VKNITGKALLFGAAAALAASMTASPASAAGVHKEIIHSCTANKQYCIAGQYWFNEGSKTRRVNAVEAGKFNSVNKTTTYYARWLYKKPGGGTQVGGGWRKAKIYKRNGQLVAWAVWGKYDSYTGKAFPKGTLICTQYKGSSQKACKKL
jgi:hypothetical protein